MSNVVPVEQQSTAMAVEPDDLETYIATFDDDEHRALASAEAAIDIAILLHRAREHRGLSQAAAARLAGLQQQAVSRLEQPETNPQLETIQTYLGALGYTLELRAIDSTTGEEAAAAILPPTSPPARRPSARSQPHAGSHRQKRISQSTRIATG